MVSLSDTNVHACPRTKYTSRMLIDFVLFIDRFISPLYMAFMQLSLNLSSLAFVEELCNCARDSWVVLGSVSH